MKHYRIWENFIDFQKKCTVKAYTFLFTLEFRPTGGRHSFLTPIQRTIIYEVFFLKTIIQEGDIFLRESIRKPVFFPDQQLRSWCFPRQCLSRRYFKTIIRFLLNLLIIVFERDVSYFPSSCSLNYVFFFTFIIYGIPNYFSPGDLLLYLHSSFVLKLQEFTIMHKPYLMSQVERGETEQHQNSRLICYEKKNWRHLNQTFSLFLNFTFHSLASPTGPRRCQR